MPGFKGFCILTIAFEPDDFEQVELVHGVECQHLFRPVRKDASLLCLRVSQCIGICRSMNPRNFEMRGISDGHMAKYVNSSGAGRLLVLYAGQDEHPAFLDPQRDPSIMQVSPR